MSIYPNLLTSYISFFLENEEVKKAKTRLENQSSKSIYFSIPLPQEIKDILNVHLGLDLSSVTSVPMRWIKGDTKPHIDNGPQEFNNTYLAYLTNSPGQLLLGDDSYEIKAGSAFIFNEGVYHETRGTGTEPRLLLGPMSEQGLPVGISQIDGPGGTSAYIREITPGTTEYSYDQTNWNPMFWPYLITNNDTSAGVFTIEFVTDITLTDINDYFVCGSEKVQFGSSSLKIDGSRPTINITAANYEGLILNGSSFSNGQNNITVCNLIIDGTGGSQALGEGWFGRSYFGKGTTGCSIINCSSSGDILGGGILGDYAENTTVIGCSSSGDLTSFNAGGIAGAEVNTLTIKSCWSTGNIASGGTGDGCGGLVGANCINCTIMNCYFTGTISGSNSGGIIGSNPGISSVTITNCYSTGAITGPNAGGICGSIGVGTFNITITNCYTVGNLDNSGSNNNGSICGLIVGTVTLLITNCYTTGTVAQSTGYIIATNTTINGVVGSYILSNNYSEAGSPGGSAGSWDTIHASTYLQNTPSNEPGVNTVWISTGISQPYELFQMGYTPYSINNISGSDLVRNETATIEPGASSSPAIISGKSYTILEITGGDTGSYGTISIDGTTGSISTTAATIPETYIIFIRNTGSYNITTFALTVGSGSGSGQEVTCCDRPMNLVNVDYSERNKFIAGNTMIADSSVRRAAYTSYSDYLHKKMAYAAKLS